MKTLKFFLVLLIVSTYLFSQSSLTGTNPFGVSKGVGTPTMNCNIGDIFFKTDATAGSNLYGCTAANTWTAQGGSGSGLGYVIQVAQSAAGHSPGDASTYYIGAGGFSPTGTEGRNKIYIPKAGTIKVAVFGAYVSGTLGSNETSTVSIRLNATTDTSLSASVKMDAVWQEFTNTGLSIAVALGDTVEFKWVTPTWATNPTSNYYFEQLYVE